MSTATTTGESTTPLFSGGERNDIREDLEQYELHLIHELLIIHSIKGGLSEPEIDEGHFATILRALRLRTDGPKAWRIASTREWKARRDLIEKIEDIQQSK